MGKILVIHTRSNSVSPLSRNVISQLLELSLEVIILSADYSRNCADILKLNDFRVKQFNLNHCRKFSEFIISQSIKQIIVFDDSFIVFYPFFKISRFFGIRTVWIQHGIYSNFSSSRSLLRFLDIEKIYRNIRYISYLLEAHVIVGIEVRKLLRKVIRMVVKDEAVLPKVTIEGFRADVAFVFDENWKQRAILEKNYSDGDVYIVKNLKDDLSGDSERFIFSLNSKKIVYIDQPLVELGLLPMREFMRFAKELVECIPRDYHLIVSKHPKSSTIKLDRAFPNSDIDVFHGETSLLIGHYSSIFYSVQWRVPCIQVRLGNLEIYEDKSLFDGCYTTDNLQNLSLELLLSKTKIGVKDKSVKYENFKSLIQKLFS